MWRDKWEPKGATAALVAGQPQNIDLTTGVQNQRLVVTVTGTMTVGADAANTIANRGSILAAVEAAVSEGGFDTWQQIDCRMIRVLSELLSAFPLPFTRITAAQAVAGGAFNLREQFIVNFANPMAVRPRESCYLEANSAQRFQFRVQLRPNAGAQIVVVGGAGTQALTNVVVDVRQEYAITEPGLPGFKPQWRIQTQGVAAANVQLQQLILTPHRLRGILLQQDSDQGEQTGIINALALRGDNVDIVGPQQIAWQNLRDTLTSQFGGVNDVAGASVGTPLPDGYMFFNFCPNGRNSALLYPNAQTNNLRFEYNAAPLGGGVTGDVIRLALLEYARPEPIAGKRVVTADVPGYATIGG